MSFFFFFKCFCFMSEKANLFSWYDTVFFFFFLLLSSSSAWKRVLVISTPYLCDSMLYSKSP